MATDEAMCSTSPKGRIGVHFGPPKISMGPVFRRATQVNPDFIVGKNSKKEGLKTIQTIYLHDWMRKKNENPTKQK